MTTAVPSNFAVNHESGLIGTWLTTLLCGLALAQAYNYFNEYPADNVWLKSAVWVVTLLNVAHAAVAFSALYHYLFIAGSDLKDQVFMYWAIGGSVALHICIDSIVLGYFTWMCYGLLSQNKIQKPAILVLGIIVGLHLGFGVASVVCMFIKHNLLDIDTIKQSTFLPMLYFQVIADILISITLCLALPKLSLVTEHTRRAIEIIIVYTVSRGIATSAAALVELITIAVDSHALWFMATEYVVGSLYANTFLSSLNTRNRIRNRLFGPDGSRISTRNSAPISVQFRRPDGSASDCTTNTSTASEHAVSTVPPGEAARASGHAERSRDNAAMDKV